MTMDETALKQLVRQVLAEQSGTDPGSRPGERDPRSGVTCVRAAEVRPKPFATGKSGAEVYLSDVLTVAESPRLGCGVMEMHASSFPWTLKYDEIDYVIEGCLEIVVDGRTVTAKQGDILYIPRDTSIEFSAPDFARFVYVTYPANWEEQV